MSYVIATLAAGLPIGVAQAPGGPLPYVICSVLLAGGFAWQVLRLRQRSKVLRERQERVGGLESLLAISARIHAFRDPEHLLNEIAESVRASMGFRMVLLRIYEPEERVFEAKATAGIDEEGVEYLRNTPITLPEFRKLAQDRFRVSNSYLIHHAAEGADQAMAGGYVPNLGERQEGEWDERDALVVPLTSPEGEIVGYLSVDDPVDRKIPSVERIQMLELFAQQAATAIASADLYARLHHQNLELTRSADRLRYHNELKNNFVANVSHELRTPLTSIKAYSEALLHGRDRMDDEARDEFLQVIQHESEKLTGIVNNLLDLERMEREQVTFNRHQTDLVALVKGLEGSARSEAEAKKITLTTHLDCEEILLGVDADLVRQLIRHLLDNACKFTPAGGKVHLSVIDGVSSVRIVVEDNGIGIPDNKMAYIFDRFYQVDGSSTREHGGQGIGLAICRDIVARHGGRIWGERVQPQGVRFNALLPRRDEIVRRGQNNGRNTIFNDVPEFAEKLIHWVGELMRVRNVSLMVPDRGGEHLVIEAAMGHEDGIVQETRVSRGQGAAGKSWATARTVQVDGGDVRPLDGIKARAEAVGQICTPVLRDGLVAAVVCASNRLDGRNFNMHDQLLLEAVADRLGHILDRVESQQRSQRDGADPAQGRRHPPRPPRRPGRARARDRPGDRPRDAAVPHRTHEPLLRPADLRPGPHGHSRRDPLQGAGPGAGGVGDHPAARAHQPAHALEPGRAGRGPRHRAPSPRALRRQRLPRGPGRRGHPPGRPAAQPGRQPHGDAAGSSLQARHEPRAGPGRDGAPRRQPLLPALPGRLRRGGRQAGRTHQRHPADPEPGHGRGRRTDGGRRGAGADPELSHDFTEEPRCARS